MYLGLKHISPYIEEAVEKMYKDGIKEAVTVVLRHTILVSQLDHTINVLKKRPINTILLYIMLNIIITNLNLLSIGLIKLMKL